MTFADRGTVTRRALPYAAGLAALLVAAGCTAGEPTPNASTAVPSMTSSSATTASPSVATTTTKPTPTVDPVIAKIPAAARPETPEGSVAFTKYFIQQVNTAFTTAEPSALDELFAPTCKACTAFRDGARELADNGLRHDGVSITTTEANTDQYGGSKRTVAIWVVQNSVPVVTSSGKKVRSTTAGTGTFLATLKFQDHWVIANLQVVK